MINKLIPIDQFAIITKSKIVKNFLSLSTAELTGKIISLLTFAYLARVLTPSGFGIIGFATAFVSYFSLAVNFGMETYGTREIAKHNQILQTNIVSAIITSRIILLIPIFSILMLTIISLNKDITLKIAMAIAALNLLSSAISIDWYFLGIQKMNYVARKQVFTSLLNFLMIVIFIKNKNDVLIAIAITSISFFINTLWLSVICYNFFTKFTFVINKPLVKQVLKEATPIAISSFMIGIYYNLDIIMIGFMKDDYDVGIYNAAVKIMMAAAVFNTYMKSIYPEISRRWEVNKADFKSYIQNIVQIVWVFAFSFMSLTIFSKNFIHVLYGSQYSQAYLPTGILLVNQCIIWFFSPFAFPLVAINQQKYFLRAIFFGAIANVLLNIILIPKYTYNGAAIATLISEVIVGIYQIVVFKKITEIELLRFARIPLIFLFVELVIVITSQYFINNLFLSLALAAITFFLLAKKYDLVSNIRLL